MMASSLLKRFEKIHPILTENNVDLLFLNDPVYLLYLTGLHLSRGQLLIGQEGATLFVDGRYLEYAKERSPIPVSTLTKESLIASLQVEKRALSVGFDSNKLTYAEFEELTLLCKEVQVQRPSHLVHLVPLVNPLKEIRAIKDSDEIAAMKRASALNWRGFEHVCSLLKEGVTEKGMAKAFEIFCLKEGADRMSFPPHIAFGKNSAYPHHTPGDTSLNKEDLVLIDVGVVVDDYCSDMTRTLFLGEAKEEWQEIYSLVRMAHAHALSLCRPGAKISEIDSAVRTFFKERGVLHEFVHALGHGVGLQIHEFPSFKENAEERELMLKPGMVFTIEPGLYRVGLGGVRYEDTILITPSGYENFYAS